MTETLQEIAVTPKAIAKIRQAFTKMNVSEGGLRLGVLGGGCSGLSYQFKFDAKPRANEPAPSNSVPGVRSSK